MEYSIVCSVESEVPVEVCFYGQQSWDLTRSLAGGEQTRLSGGGLEDPPFGINTFEVSNPEELYSYNSLPNNPTNQPTNLHPEDLCFRGVHVDVFLLPIFFPHGVTEPIVFYLSY